MGVSLRKFFASLTWCSAMCQSMSELWFAMAKVATITSSRSFKALCLKSSDARCMASSCWRTFATRRLKHCLQFPGCGRSSATSMATWCMVCPPLRIQQRTLVLNCCQSQSFSTTGCILQTPPAASSTTCRCRHILGRTCPGFSYFILLFRFDQVWSVLMTLWYIFIHV